MNKDLLSNYGPWERVLLAVSVGSIFVGLIVSSVFLYKISGSLSIISEGKRLHLQSTGMVGDFIGGVIGPIWSLTGVLLFYLALRLQSKELKLQVTELKETKEVFIAQQFESTYFNLLQVQQDIKLNIEVEKEESVPGFKHETKLYKSYAFFEMVRDFMIVYNREVTKKYKEIMALDPSDEFGATAISVKTGVLLKKVSLDDFRKLNQPVNRAKVVYRAAYIKYSHQLSHYFRSLYHILAYLHENEERELSYSTSEFMNGEVIDVILNGKSLNEKIIRDKYKRYAQFLQAQMSTSELFLVYYNGLFFPKMKYLIHHYDFLENMNSDDLLDKVRDEGFYEACRIDNKVCSAINLKSKGEMLSI